MKKNATPFLLLGLLLVFGSFKPDDENGHYKNNGYFFAILNGTMFEMRDDDKYRAELVNKTGSMNNSKAAQLSRVATSLIFYGNNFTDENGKIFTENIEFEYSFADGALGEPKDMKFEINYDKHVYYHLPDQSKFRITGFQWSDDHTFFLMNADFDCKMRRWGFPAESQPIVRVKGRMVNINVTVPAWVKLKDATQVAGN
ncbi:MAG: hypothetical protein IPH78_07425 [Bacteroidetes bacterium]|nr:hypothetical protein [Bacteroidota bacterium]MBK8657875.1 hypothetical protein [Bacteroidota bacterium]